MERIGRNGAAFQIMPGIIDWLSYQKDPDGLINKLVIEYRHARRRPAPPQELIDMPRRQCD